MTTQQRDQKAENAEVKRRMQNPEKPALPPIKTFLVRRSTAHNDPLFGFGIGYSEEGIEAHRYDEHANGSVSFYRYLEVDNSDRGLFYTYSLERLLAAGTFYDIREVTKDFQTQPAN